MVIETMLEEPATVGPSRPEPAPRFLPRADFDRLIESVRRSGREVIGPTVRDGAVMLDRLSTADELPVGWTAVTAPGRNQLVRTDNERLFDQPPGPTSWKRWTYPPRVPQFVWAANGGDPSPQPVVPVAEPKAYLGVRACEIAALAVQDRVLLDGPVVDPDYRARRADTLVVAVECAVAGSTCFCSSMGTGPEVTAGFDVALNELDEGFVVRSGSDAGAALVEELQLPPATAEQTQRASASVAAVRAAMGTPLPTEGLPARLKAAAKSPRWAEIAERCLACTNCTLVCPTCFCTSVAQRSELDGQNAASDRVWESCFTLDFARVAGGGNFRPRVEDRYRQWLTHKFATWWDQFGTSGCVGCGRCISWCPVGIDVRAELMAVAPPSPAVSPVAPLPALGPMVAPVATPQPAGVPQANGAATELGAGLPWITARVVATRRETHDVMTLRLQHSDPALLAGRPGQFVMAALPALAAPPISVSRFHTDGLELTIRAAGAATTALCNLDVGAAVALRGPLGRGWPVEKADGRDVIIVTGGIGLAPLRPLVDALLARRDRIGAIQLAYGARTPADRLYLDELEGWAASRDIDLAVTVDRAGPEWLGRVGVVTQVIDRAMCSCDRTVAFVCGPERMMEATADVLGERGVPPERMFVTLERHMDCGVGLCGHCQLGQFFVCRDGPVFSLTELGPSFRLEGL